LRCYTCEVDLPEPFLEPIRRVATTFPEVRAIYIFGSQAVGGARPDSDLDLALDLARHVLAKGFGRAPAEYGEVARQLGEVGVVNPDCR